MNDISARKSYVKVHCIRGNTMCDAYNQCYRLSDILKGHFFVQDLTCNKLWCKRDYSLTLSKSVGSKFCNDVLASENTCYRWYGWYIELMKSLQFDVHLYQLRHSFNTQIDVLINFVIYKHVNWVNETDETLLQVLKSRFKPV